VTKLSVKGIDKSFGDIVALHAVSFALEGREFLSLLGPSGCGKTTTLRLIAGFDRPDAGEILLDGKDILRVPPEKRHIGFVFQNYALFPHMSVTKNIAYGIRFNRHIDRKRRVGDLLELVGLRGFERRKPAELSAGQRQRVALARALAPTPQLLLLDEPLSALDAKLRESLRTQIRRIQRELRLSTIYVTHDQEEASSIADQVVLMKQGLLQQVDTARKLYDEPVNFFVADFLGVPPINKLYGTMLDGSFRFRDSEVCCEFPLRRAVQNGTDVIMAVRPESVIVPAGERKLKSLVLERYSIGKDELSLLSIEGQHMRAYISGDYPIHIGDPMEFSLKKKGVFLFDANTGERLS